MSCAERPVPPGPPEEYEPAEETALEMRLAKPLEEVFKRCRGGTPGTCPHSPVAAIIRENRRGHKTAWLNCGAHLFGRWVESGKVMAWRRKDDLANEGPGGRGSGMRSCE